MQVHLYTLYHIHTYIHIVLHKLFIIHSVITHCIIIYTIHLTCISFVSPTQSHTLIITHVSFYHMYTIIVMCTLSHLRTLLYTPPYTLLLY
jgi:hypothetical protein